ncbi:MAG TPA: hypothetical protein VGO11_14995 [Chthoniobacteraceae bacterium]|jgi:hypothetical protein|nr:hypothetical protein [Chthoniobacteraceae bacterium]
MNDLESRLARLPLRSAPAEWRLQILRAAQAARPAERVAPWWQRWLTPQRLALAGAWLLILLLKLTSPGERGKGTPSEVAGWQELWTAREQMVARLLNQPAAPEAEPRFPQGAVFARRLDRFV